MALSPMMQEYLARKEEYSDCILLYRVGDFYEMFFDDAKTVSKELELTLTGKECGLPERAPMAGVPYHAVDTYIGRLIRLGHKVAVCDQVEDPRFAKGLVKREVTRVVTPGTSMNVEAGEEGRNNFLMSIYCTSDRFGIAACDVSTGEFRVTETDRLAKLLDEINRYAPSEMICNEALLMSGLDTADLKNRFRVLIEPMDERYFSELSCSTLLKDHFHVQSLEGLGLDLYPTGTCAAGALLSYLLETQKTELSHISRITPYHTEAYMVLGTQTMRNLELVETLREKEKRGSLLWVLDKTKTAMGARMLRSWVEQPLIRKEEIDRRLDAVSALTDDLISCEELREYLNPVYDLERLLARISYHTASPRDLLAFGSSLTIKTSGTCPAGVSVPIPDDATFVNLSGRSEMRISKTRQQLKALGLLPSQDEDGVNEMAVYDVGSIAGIDGSNLSDSNAFLALGAAERGVATGEPSQMLTSDPPRASLSESFLRAAGCEIMVVTYGGLESNKRQIMNQADILYYSGHGFHKIALLDDYGPSVFTNRWNRDLNCLVVSGCSILDVNDYNNNFALDPEDHVASPGKLWENVGPNVMLGYNYYAPADDGGVPARVAHAWVMRRGLLGDVDAWMEANAVNRAWNACAIVKGQKYVYFEKVLWGFMKRKKEIQKEDW